MNKRANDISLCEKIFSHFRYWQDFIVMLFYLKKTFKNSGHVYQNIKNIFAKKSKRFQKFFLQKFKILLKIFF
jgi:hypothetical protein